MRRRELIVSAAMLAGPGAGSRAASNPLPRRREPLVEILPNGLQLLVRMEPAVELAAVQLWIRAGGFLENEQSHGTAHLLEHLLFRTEDSSRARSVDAEVEALGGLVEAATEKDWTRLSCTVAGKHAVRVIGALGAMVRQPSFQAADLNAERPLILEELQRVDRDPDSFLVRALFARSFVKHPYRFDVRGTPELLARSSVQSARAFFEEHYRPDRMILVVVGDVDPDAIQKAAGRAFPGSAPTRKLVLPPDETARVDGQSLRISTRFSSGLVGLAYPAPAVTDLPHVHAMDLILAVLELGGVGRLPTLLRGQATVRAAFETRRQPGLLYVVAATPPGSMGVAESLIRKEVEFLAARPLPEGEFQLAKQRLLGQYILENEAYAGQAGNLGYYAAIDSWKFATEYAERMAALTPAEVQVTAERFLRGDPTVVTIAPGTLPKVGSP